MSEGERLEDAVRKELETSRDGGRSQGQRDAGFQKLERSKEVTFPLAPPVVGAQSCSYLDFRTLTSVTVK